ncbi:hypothetical protein AM587_10003443 [Phytophthora nicotianae]|uniref:Uncharacterized protein n=1 Tax=Phytophthora nicotianae TaxID=4792 RepID=A0A0W8CKE3_PHYNI|nr:hypothetical protein AM587_10003443 [Phytophthora nicotianae]
MVSGSDPFQTLQLTDEEQQDCYDRAFQLLDRTLRSYDERDDQAEHGRSHTPLPHSNLDNTRWKLLKTQENASLYKERNSCTLQDYNLLGGDWKDPVVLLMAGTINGDLDGIVFGLETPDSSALRTRLALFTKQPVDCAVLAQLAGPTEADPFRFLGITRMVYNHKWPFKAMIKRRDFVTLTATGTMTRANGDRIGYEVVQPVKLQRCPPLSGTVIRGKVMYATILKQQEPGTVDVYIHTYVETQGFILDKLVMAVTWRANIGCWGANKLVEMKKLQWYIANCRSERQKQQQRAYPSARSICRQCYDRRGLVRRRDSGIYDYDGTCVLCTFPMCYKCRVEKTLEILDENSGRLKRQLVLVCQPCWMFVQTLCPMAIARLNYKQRQRQL